MANPDINIVNTEPQHIRMMAGCMHQRIADTALRLGIAPHKALWRSYKESIICLTAFINGEIAAIWGIGGTLFGEIGHPWLVLSPEADDYPMRVAFIYKKELQKMAKMFPVLEDFVDESHEKAVRMLELMGFKMTERITVGDVNLRRAERVAYGA